MKKAAPAEDSGRPTKKDPKDNPAISAASTSKSTLTYDLDPVGYTVFVVKNVPEHLPHDFHNLKTDMLSRLSITAKPPGSLAQKKKHSLRIRASSKHLMLASPYFEKMLNGAFQEASQLQSHGYAVFPVEEWDSLAFLVTLLTIHGRSRLIPREIPLDMLADIAVLVDYYKCYEPVEVFSDIWILDLANTLPTSNNKQAQQWLFISLVFQKRKIFAKITLAIQETSSKNCAFLHQWNCQILSALILFSEH